MGSSGLSSNPRKPTMSICPILASRQKGGADRFGIVAGVEVTSVGTLVGVMVGFGGGMVGTAVGFGLEQPEIKETRRACPLKTRTSRREKFLRVRWDAAFGI